MEYSNGYLYAIKMFFLIKQLSLVLQHSTKSIYKGTFSLERKNHLDVTHCLDYFTTTLISIVKLI